MATQTDNVQLSTESTTYLGQVKWFNTKAGYGFITVTDGPRESSDIFAHHSSVVVNGEQYRYLVQGEYVEFNLATSQDDVHSEHAINIRGVKGGKLMCETRHEVRSARVSYRAQSQQAVSSETVVTPVEVEVLPVSVSVQKKPRQRGSKNMSSEVGEWTQVAKPRKKSVTSDKPAKTPRAPAKKL
jgi:cold shock CspA family protein